MEKFVCDLVYEMRRDVFIKDTELGTDQLVRLLPWYFEQEGEQTPQESP
jgi:hypothetical protein